MQQPINYRAKDFFTEEWVYGVPIPDKNIKGRWWMIQAVGGPEVNNEVIKTIISPETICIALPLLDANGAQLFEKDIVNSVLQYDAGHDTTIVTLLSMADLGTLDYYSDKIYKIGNSFDNPELIPNETAQ
jgi:hypothetical protein